MRRKSDGLRIVGINRSEVEEGGGAFVVEHTKAAFRGEERTQAYDLPNLPRNRAGRVLSTGRLRGETILIAVENEHKKTVWVPSSNIEFEDGDDVFTE